MLENAKTISQNELAALRLAFEQDTAARAMQNAASKTAIGDLVYHGDSRIGNDHLFSLELKTM